MIRDRYREQREKEEIAEMRKHDEWRVEAIENFAIVDNGQYKHLLVSAWKTNDDVVKYMDEIYEAYISENAKIIVIREMENMSEQDMKDYLYKHIRERSDVITLERIA